MVNKRSKKEDRLYTCEKCGKIKEAKYPALKKRFCSFKCSNQWKWDNVRKHERKKEHNCDNCGKKCKKEKTKEIKEGVFCSKKCFYEYRHKNPPTWLIPFPKGHEPFNKEKTMDMDFRIICKARAEKQWEDLDFREKQMQRDFSKFNKAGIKALRIFWDNPENAWRRKQAGETLHKQFLGKVGAIPNE